MKTWAALLVGAAVGAGAVLAACGSGLAWRNSRESIGLMRYEIRTNILTGETWERMIGTPRWTVIPSPP